MNWLISTAIRLRVALVVLTILLVFGGLRKVKQAPLDVFPEFAPPRVEIQTEAPGLSTSDVESLVTVPIENALTGVSWLKTLRSKSVLGLSSVTLEFEDHTDLIKARQLVQERLGLVAPNLPKVAEPPVILSPLSSTSRLLKVGISSEKLNQTELTTIAKWTIRPRLMAIPGIANVAIWGERDRQLQIQIDPDRLRNHQISMDQVLAAASTAIELHGGGFIDTPNQRLAVTHVPAVYSVDNLAAVIVAYRNGSPIVLGDVADVVEGFSAPIGNAIINRGPGILLIVEKQPWANTLELTRKLEARLAALKPGLKDIEIDSTIFRPATFIEMSLANLNTALVIGCALVIAVLIIFLYDWRTALISVLAIPTSLIIAIVVLIQRGGTINTMVLAGLVIALGEVVDDAIIDVENIMRRLRLNKQMEDPLPAFNVVLNASLEVRSSVVYGSLIVAVVLIPVFMLEGLAGAFFRPLAMSYILAIGSSLLVALTLTPALSFILLPSAAATRSRESPIVRMLKRIYRKMLRPLLKSPGVILAGFLGIVAVTLYSIRYLGEEFLPRFKEYDFLMHWVEKPGISIEAMDRITIRAAEELLAVDGVRNFGAHIGRAEVADEVVGPNFTELWISLEPTVEYDETVAKIQSIVDGYPGLYRDLLTYLRERIKEVLTGSSASVVIRIYGPNLEKLQEKAEEIAKVISTVDGIADLKVQPQTLVPNITVRCNTDAAAKFGLNPGEITRTLVTLIKGAKVGEIYEDQKIFDVVVWSVPQHRSSFEVLYDLMIECPSGAMVPLRDIATISMEPTPNQISREAASRRIDVTCNSSGRDLGGVVGDIRNRLASVPFEHGYYPEIIGEYAALKEAERRLTGIALLSLLGIFFILHTDFQSFRTASLIFTTLPFCLIGGVASVFMSGGILSLGSIVGFVTVLGIAARNGILLISHYRHLRTNEGIPFGPELILRGAEERIAPILMTALTTGLALLPIILGGIKPGHEIEHPTAVVIVGGLATSTILNLLILPVLYLKFGNEPRPEQKATAASEPTSG